MPKLYELTAETLTQGTVITQANTGLDADAAGTNNTATADSVYAVTPNVRGVKLKFGTVGVNGGVPTNGMALQKNFPAGPLGTRVIAVFKAISFANINTQMDIITFRSAAGASTARLRKLDDGRLQLIGPSTASPFGTTTFNVANSTRYDFQVDTKIGASTGTLALQITATGSATVLASLSFTAQALGTDLLQGIRFGSSNIPSAATEYGFDSFEMHEQVSGYVASTTTAPRVFVTVNAGFSEIDLTGTTGNLSDSGLTFVFTPSAGIYATTDPYRFFGQPGTYSVVGTNASAVSSQPDQVVIRTASIAQSVVLRKWDATAAAYI